MMKTKLLRREPTVEMCTAPRLKDWPEWGPTFREVFQAMFDAAPEIEATDEALPAAAPREECRWTEYTPGGHPITVVSERAAPAPLPERLLRHAEWLRRLRHKKIPDDIEEAAAALAQSAAPSDIIKAATDRFLSWPLPRDFAPDCGISFDGRKDDEWNKDKTWPIGTNLFTADQAEAMFKHCLAALAQLPPRERIEPTWLNPSPIVPCELPQALGLWMDEQGNCYRLVGISRDDARREAYREGYANGHRAATQYALSLRQQNTPIQESDATCDPSKSTTRKED